MQRFIYNNAMVSENSNNTLHLLIDEIIIQSGIKQIDENTKTPLPPTYKFTIQAFNSIVPSRTLRSVEFLGEQ
jgi:hypothetical protein